MGDKQLKDKAIKIQGKDYVLVSDRIIYFNKAYPNGSITTEIVSWEDKIIVIKATITPNVHERNGRKFTAFSQEKEGEGFINKTSALENAETSAIGRALALMGIGVIDSIASVDEINKAKNRTGTQTSVKEQIKETSYLSRLKKHIMDNLPEESKKLSKEEITEEADRYIERETGQVIKIKDLDEKTAKKLYFDLLNKNGKSNS